MGSGITKPIHPEKKHSSTRMTPYLKTQNEFDIHIPLTEREILEITRSWRAISTNMINTGMSMFLK